MCDTAAGQAVQSDAMLCGFCAPHDVLEYKEHAYQYQQMSNDQLRAELARITAIYGPYLSPKGAALFGAVGLRLKACPHNKAISEVIG